MPAFVDDSQIQTTYLTAPDGSECEAVVIPVAVPVSEVAGELAEYDPESGIHPLASQAKPLARPLLDALAAYMSRADA